MGLDVLFGFSGRINRAKYWLATLIQVIFFYGAVFSAVVLVDAFDGATAEYRYSPFPTVMAVLALLIAAISQIAVSMQRAHDCNRSGFFVLLLFVPPLSIWPAVEFGFMRGSIGPNRYGPDPLARRDIRNYSEEIERNAKDARALVARGGLLGLEGEYDRAIADLDAAIALDPKDAEAFNSRAFVYLRRGRLADARADYDLALQLRPKSAEALYGRGVARLRAADEAGKADLAVAAAINPQIADTMAILGITA